MSLTAGDYMPYTIDAPGRAFLDVCEAQDVGLQREVYDNLYRTPHATPDQYIYQSSVARTLESTTWRVDRGMLPQLAERPIQIEALPDDPVHQLLGALINISIDPGESSSRQPRSWNKVYKLGGMAYKNADVCLDAEMFWRDIYTAYADPEKGELPNVEIFVDRLKRPVLMRKGRGNATALTLREFEHPLCDLRYPRGSIANIDAPMPSSGWGKLDVPPEAKGVLISPLSSVTGFSVNRLAINAVEGEQRETHFGTSNRNTNLPTMDQFEEMAEALVAERTPSRRIYRVVSALGAR